MCVCVTVGEGGRGSEHSKHSPQGASLLSLSNGLKSSFNEYRVKLNGKSIMAIKAGGFTRAAELFKTRTGRLLAEKDGDGEPTSPRIVLSRAGRERE